MPDKSTFESEYFVFWASIQNSYELKEKVQTINDAFLFCPYLRNKMSQQRLQNLMLISNENDISEKLDLDVLTGK